LLSKRLSPNCATAFVKHSGYKLLRRWLKIAEEEGRLEELRLIVSVCKSLPFEATAVRDSEIGKAIKKLLKYRPPASASYNYHSANGNASVDAQLGLLTEEVKKLMKIWTDEISKAASSESQDTKQKALVSLDPSQLPNFVLSLADRLGRSRSKDQPTDQSHAQSRSDSSKDSATTNPPTDRQTSIQKSSVVEAKGPSTSAAPTTMAAKMMMLNSQSKAAATPATATVTTAAAASSQPSTAASRSTPNSSQGSSSFNLSWLNSTTADVKAVAENAASVPRSSSTATSTAATRERKNDVMIEEAKRQLALREMGSSSASATAASSTVPNASLAPGPSVLKRKADNQSQPPRKRAKMSIQCKQHYPVS
jgi:hypothetical protein